MPVGTLSLPLGSVLTGQPEVIGSSVLTAGAASVSFQFPPVYRAVLIECWDKQSGGGGSRLLRLNNDSAGNYSAQIITASAAAVAGVRRTAQTSIRVDAELAADLSTKGSMSILVVKTTAAARAQVVVITNPPKAPADIALGLVGGEWNNTTDLLTRVDIVDAGGTMVANTSITCWGWRR